MSKPIGTEHTNSKFDKSDLSYMQQLRNAGLSYNKIAKKLQVSKSTTMNFLKGITYKKEYLNEK